MDLIRRIRPPADLAPLVEEFSARDAVGPRVAFPVFPSARAELIFHFADQFQIAGDTPANARQLPRAALLGPRDSIHWQIAGPAISWFLIQLTPLGCRRLLGAPFAELWQRDADLGAFWGSRAAALHERLRETGDFDLRVAAASALLRVLARDRGGDVAASRAGSLARSGRLERIEQMARMLDVGPRRLRQRFVAEVGIGPKRFLSLMRFGRLLTTSHPRPWHSGVEAIDCDYADESHAIREFRRFAGMTPGAYRVIKSRGDDLVFTGAQIRIE